jgi:hypothetical protein
MNRQVSTKNKIQATGTLPIPLLKYDLGIVNWRQEDVQKLSRKIRKMLTIQAQHHPRADIDHFYVSRKGGRGMMEKQGDYMAEIMKLMVRVESKDPLIRTVRTQ